MHKGPGTVKEIAQALNLSSGTVSRVLNGRGDLAQETRSRVFELAAELNYAPRRKAPLPTNSLTRVALCLGNPCVDKDGALDPSYFGFHVLNRLQQVAADAGIGVLVSFVDATVPNLRIDHLPALQPGEAQGIILVYPFPEAVVRRLTMLAPVISLEHIYPGLPVDVVGPTHAQDAMSAVEQLHLLGHRRIAYVGDDGATGHKLTQGLRHAGFVAGLNRCGLPYLPGDVLNVHDANSTPKPRLAQRIAELHADGVTAVISSIDRHGYLLWDELPQLGISIPNDISLVGIGGIHRATGLPQLTTFRCDYDGIARGALEALKARKSGQRSTNLYREISSVFVPGTSSALRQGL